ncbi:hypothetical protein M422DRAFT_275395 [Sphaerobolus stellatus SS14]|uniref:Unplaced genomic scaffold SPHSTscaffold_485, whole genome shotgun sequence n=1 Tax=Sphaerobolus stellatus (strain SS14) TaxID=990650 RepID=A0A0C9TPU6_SPHS4|nr:hypothetical protein M422DRAFT_275395 [Sphaerobolus stellatus SS14]
MSLESLYVLFSTSYRLAHLFCDSTMGRLGGGEGGLCGGPRGFCGKCFDRGFDEDQWDKEDSSGAGERGPTTEQPSGVKAMTTTPDSPQAVTPVVHTNGDTNSEADNGVSSSDINEKTDSDKPANNDDVNEKPNSDKLAKE